MILLLIPVALYLTILVAVYFGQTALLFPVGQVAPAGPLPPRAERITIKAASGERLVGLHIPPAAASREPLLILGFGGNAWNGDAVAAYLHVLFPEAHVVAFHYRGYPPSEGRPSAAAIAADAPLILDFARQRVGPARIVAVGFSVGSGVAASLAAARPLDGLILITPFDSLAEVAAGHYPWLPVRTLFRHRLEPARELAGTTVPVAIIAGQRDSLIPPARTDALRAALPRTSFDRIIAGAGHNDIYQRHEFEVAMRAARASLQRDLR
jgi:pimeloyl-ACP methyl ester carboxylesterase